MNPEYTLPMRLHNLLAGLMRRCRRRGRADRLYVFLHMPKCAGTTLAHHVRRNFRPEEALAVYLNEPQSFFDPRSRRYECLTDWRDVDHRLAALTDADRGRVRVLYGHDVYYGIDKLFGKPARYITFLRDPVGRLVSWYDMFRKILDSGRPLESFPAARCLVTESGRARPFREWFLAADAEHGHLTRNSMTGHFLYRFGRRKIPWSQLTAAHVDEAKAVLDEFCLVGTAAGYDRCAPALYAEMDITRRYPDENVSRKKFCTSEEIESCVEVIRSKNPLDQALYEYAQSRETSEQ